MGRYRSIYDLFKKIDNSTKVVASAITNERVKAHRTYS